MDKEKEQSKVVTKFIEDYKEVEQSKAVTEFIEDYKEVKELVMGIADTLRDYIDEFVNMTPKFEEFLGDYNVKLSAVVINAYDKDRKQIHKLLDNMDKQIKKNTELKDLDEYIQNIRDALQELDDLYEKGSLDSESEMEDVHYDLELPFDDLENIFDDEEWDYN